MSRRVPKNGRQGQPRAQGSNLRAGGVWGRSNSAQPFFKLTFRDPLRSATLTAFLPFEAGARFAAGAWMTLVTTSAPRISSDPPNGADNKPTKTNAETAKNNLTASLNIVILTSDLRYTKIYEAQNLPREPIALPRPTLSLRYDCHEDRQAWKKCKTVRNFVRAQEWGGEWGHSHADLRDQTRNRASQISRDTPAHFAESALCSRQ